MAAWDDGYVTDVTYTTNIFREATPVWLAMTALMMGQRCPDLARPFRYADLGCGHGLTAIAVAATCPHAEVWGFDFNPAHIESGRELATAAGLTNVRFQEAAFADLAQRPAQGLPDFDFMVSHGVLSWISPENQRHLVNVVGQRLRPGGLCYLSYNVATGWGAMPPLRLLMRLLLRSTPARSDLAAQAVLDYLDRMKQANAGFFAANPSLEQRLAEIRKQDPRYIAHEFLNQDWHPLMFADMAAALEQEKCAYIGSATLTENIDVVAVPQTMAAMIQQTPDPVLRETLRDFAAAKGFRRDVYRRGLLPLPGVEHVGLIDALALEWLGQPVADPISLPTPLGSVTGLPELYGPLVEILRNGPATIGAIRTHPALAGRSLADLLQVSALLISGGYAHPVMPESVRQAASPGCRRLNAALMDGAVKGRDIGQLVSPVIGSAVKVDLIEALLMREVADGQRPETGLLTDAVRSILERLGRGVERASDAASDPADLLKSAVTSFLDARLPTAVRLGIV